MENSLQLIAEQLQRITEQLQQKKDTENDYQATVKTDFTRKTDNDIPCITIDSDSDDVAPDETEIGNNSAGNFEELDGEETNLEVNPNGPIIIVVQYSSPPSSPSNAEQDIDVLQFNSSSNDDNQINMNEDIASGDEIDHVDAEDAGDGDLEEDQQIDNMEIEENDLYDRQENDNVDSMNDGDENAGEASDHDEDQVNMSDVEENDEEYLVSDEDSSDDTTDEGSASGTTDDGDAEGEPAAGPSTSTGGQSTRPIVPERQIKAKKTVKLSIITKKLKCTVPGCKKVVQNKNALNYHLLSSHKLKLYRCLVRPCYGKVSTSFTTRSQLTDHRDLVHGTPTRWACHCFKKFKSYQDLSSHYRQYHQLGRFACSKDGCTFKPTSTRIQVLTHQYSHREAKYECSVDGCDRSFKQKCHLNRHLLTHHGQRPFVCTECDLSFTQKGHLTAHLRSHRNDKCFRCTWPECTHSATIRGSVITHIRMVHFKLPQTKKQQAEEGIQDDRDPSDYLARD